MAEGTRVESRATNRHNLAEMATPQGGKEDEEGLRHEAPSHVGARSQSRETEPYPEICPEQLTHEEDEAVEAYLAGLE